MSHIDRRPVLCLLLLWAPGVDGPLRYHFHHGRDGQNLPGGGRVDSWSGQAVSQKVPGSLFRSSLCAKSELDWKLGELWNARETLDLQELLKSKKIFGTCIVPSHVDHLQLLVRPLRYLDCSACHLGLSVESKSSRAKTCRTIHVDLHIWGYNRLASSKLILNPYNAYG